MGSQSVVPPRLFGVLARRAPVCVLLQRGPTQWVRLIRWDLSADRFATGPWFHGRIYERRADLSPNGELLVYFASKRNWRPRAAEYSDTWTALSRPPQLKAITLWPKGDAWDGGGWFRTDSELCLNHCGEPAAHPDHPVPKKLRVVCCGGRGEDLPIYHDILSSKGWTRPDLAAPAWHKPSPDGRLILRQELECVDFQKPGGPLHFLFSLLDASNGELLALLDGVHWAEWDARGRLLATRGGHVWSCLPEARLLRDESKPGWTALADFREDRPPIGGGF